MKIAKIKLKNYHLFEDITIDLTYPQRHKKAGEPLDKVCIIGQSGTGKTSLIRLINWFISGNRRIEEGIVLPLPPPGSVEMEIRFSDIGYSLYNSDRAPFVRPIFRRGNPLDMDNQITDHIKKTKPLLINFPAERLSERFFKESTEKKEKESKKTGDIDKDIPPFGLYPQVIDFAFRDPKKNLDYFLKDIEEYRTNKLYFLNEISKLKSQPKPIAKKIQEKQREEREWLKNNPDPVKTLADEFLDEILQHLGLKVKIELDRPSIRNLEYIQLQTLSGQDVPGEYWSTGTHQLVMNALPLFQLKPKDAIILFDEPERSLYPDIQSMIIPFYIRPTEECQFFFATHSLIVASAFKPWEIVKLKFDREHRRIHLERLYEGENSVENYRAHPEYLRWDLILQDIFKMEEEGGEKRIKALNDFAKLNVRIRDLKANNQLDTPEGQDLIEKARELGEKLHWRTERNK